MTDFSLCTDYVYGSTQPSSFMMFNEPTYTNSMDMICCSLMWPIVLGIYIFIFISYYQLQNSLPSLIETSTKLQLAMNQYNTTSQATKNNKLNKLSAFVPLQSCRLIHIHHKTSVGTIDELIAEAEQTTPFTIFPINKNTFVSKMSIQIEFVQQSRSLILAIEVNYQYSSNLLRKITHLAAIIFHWSNIIQTWGDIRSDLLEYQEYDFPFHEVLYRVRMVNIQEDFKRWYNRTFRHDTNCDQTLVSHDLDGSLCSCSHRPYHR